MALIFYEGFDDTNNQTDLINKNSPLMIQQSWVAAYSTTPRFGTGTGQAVFDNGNNGSNDTPAFYLTNPNVTTDMIVGWSMIVDATRPAPNGNWLTIYDTTAQAVEMAAINPAYLLQARGDGLGNMSFYDNWGNVLATVVNIPFRDSAWHYYEFRYKCDPVAGVIQLKIDGTFVLNITGINTATVGGRFNRILMQGAGYSTNFSGVTTRTAYDDVYLVDNSDSTGFLGEVRNVYVVPASDSTPINFTPNSGSNHFSRVSEILNDGDTSYNQSTTVGDIDTYQLTGVSITSSSVLGVQPCVWTRTVQYPTTFDFAVGFGGTFYYQSTGAGYVPTTSYLPVLGKLYTLNPNTGITWANSDIGNSFVRIKRLT